MSELEDQIDRAFRDALDVVLSESEAASYHQAGTTPWFDVLTAALDNLDLRQSRELLAAVFFSRAHLHHQLLLHGWIDVGYEIDIETGMRMEI